MIPSREDMMNPILSFLADGKSYHKQQIEEHIATHFDLTQEEKNQTMPNSRRTKILYSISWICTQMKYAGLITVEKANVTITEEGKNILKQGQKVDNKFLRTIPKYKTWRNKNKQFSFTKKDFDSTTGRQDDAKYLSGRFKDLKKILKEQFDDPTLRWIVSRPNNIPNKKSNTKWKDYMWLAFTTNYALFKRPHESIKFQVKITKHGVACHISVNGKAKKRISFIKEQIAQYPQKFLEILKKLPDSYAVKISIINGGVLQELSVSDMTLDSIGMMSDYLSYKDVEFSLGVLWNEKESLSMGDSTIDEMKDTFDALLPAYEFLNAYNPKPASPPEPLPELEKYRRMLDKKPQIILYGPPGTGKTYTARRLASYLAGGKQDAKLVRHVTFHPSYSYEEFVEGLRPDEKGNYAVRDGIFKKICDDARRDPGNTYVLVIDEINRGRTEKIFGELITLIEGDKRQKHSAHLAYSQDEFTVPENLLIIGTMNTADRSLTYLDAALRRRFGFFELMPNYSLIKNTASEIHLDRLLKELNLRIRNHEGREKQVGHSYLMADGRPMQRIEDVRSAFTHEIIPLLQDYFYEDYDKLKNVLGDALVDEKAMEIKQLSDSEFVDALRRICDGDSQDKGA